MTNNKVSKLLLLHVLCLAGQTVLHLKCLTTSVPAGTMAISGAASQLHLHRLLLIAGSPKLFLIAALHRPQAHKVQGMTADWAPDDSAVLLHLGRHIDQDCVSSTAQHDLRRPTAIKGVILSPFIMSLACQAVTPSFLLLRQLY